MHVYKLIVRRFDAEGIERTGFRDKITAATEEEAIATLRLRYPRPLPEGYTEEISVELVATLGTPVA